MIQTIDISLIPSDNKPVINVSQFDNVSRVLRFNVFDDLGMETPHVFDDGDTVLLNIRKNDNNIVVITGVIVSDIDPETQEVTGQYLTFELTEQACACVGSNFGEVSITSGDDEVIGSCNFKLIVERSPLVGGVSSQTAIDNLTTQIEDITEQVIGDNYYDKEEIDGKFDDLDIPTKTSELENDSGFINASDIPTIPTKTSQLTNDSGFITASALPTKTSQLTNDSGFITASALPTKTSELTNDSDFINSTELNNVLSDYALWPTDQTTKSAIANFTTSLALPLVALKAYIKAQGGGGTPTTPVAISGWNSVNVTRAGKNLVLGVIEGGSIGSNGTIAGGSTQYDMVYAPIKAGDTYTISTNETTNQFVGGYFTSLPSVGSTSYDGQRVVQYSKTFTAPITGYVVFCQMSGYEYAQLEVGSMATAYVAPLTPTTFTLPLGQTIYGGYVDWENGKLVIDKAFVEFDGSEAGWTNYSAGNGYYITISDMEIGNNLPSKSNYLPQYSGVNELGLRYGFNNNVAYCYQVNTLDGVTDVESWKTYLSNNHLQVVYPLATPIEIDLPTTMPQTISGVQNWFADSGDIEVIYKCTIEEYVNNRLSNTQILNRAVTLEERSIEENLSETRDIRGYDNEE